jgi:hypothetical protein
MPPHERELIGVIEDDPVMGGTLTHRLKLEGYRFGGARDRRRSKAWVRRYPILSSATSVCPT